MKSSTSNTREVPEKFRCPVCGKWGRNLPEKLSSKIPKLWPRKGMYYCNPRARTGGKGCGELFRRIEQPGCNVITNHPINGNLRFEKRDNGILNAGRILVEEMKKQKPSWYDPYTRNASGVWGKLIKILPDNGELCNCGCGRPVPFQILGGEKIIYSDYTTECRGYIRSAAWMICYPTSEGRLYNLLKRIRGARCEKCGTENGPFDLDHIVEVNEGGGMCWVDNFQLLCPDKCHKEKTAAYSKRRARERRKEKTKQIEISFK